MWRRRRRHSTAQTSAEEGGSKEPAQGRESQAEPDETPPPDLVKAWGRMADWQAWLRRSPEALTAQMWWANADELRIMLGEDAYRERLGEVLSRLAPRDFAALGLGCNRRIDRSCRAPETCSLDPVPPAPGEARRERHGPVAGACSSFVDCHTSLGMRADFTADDRHRAVVVESRYSGVMLWVDGVRVEAPTFLDETGYWVDDRYYVVEMVGPADHPRQGHSAMGILADVLSLVIHDVTTHTTHVVDPEPDEYWPDPVAARRDGTWHLYPTREAYAANTPDRTLTTLPPPLPLQP
ncbi:hypothetical protein ABZ924_01970 [Streptomyces sp. NPDC046876]|uniref:hypothetical protein n=1 Tax=Streptomyces sp. NPDC046876 TaxID=3155616 RepID=UPI0033CEB255